MSPKFAKFLLTKILGWKYDETAPVPSKHAIILGVPHTSIWDFAIGYFYYRAVGGKMRTMIKKESFRFPQKYLLRAMGAFPMDRQNPCAMVHGIINEMENSDTFHLVICPEGTRKAVHKWKTGYHTIAKQTGADVYLGHFDWKKKEVGVYPGPFELTGTAREDTDRIQAFYEEKHLAAKDPAGYVTK